MKTWNETREVLEAARACMDNGHACAIVVLTHVKGSAFRRPGAKLLIRADGTITGDVSGGCLENDLRERAMQCIETNTQATVHYNTGSDEDVIWGLGLGCDGELDLLLVPVTKETPWIDQVQSTMDKNEPVDLIWHCMDENAQQPQLERGSASETALPEHSFLDELLPPPDLIIVGAGDDAIPLANHAASSGFRVTVVDHRAGYLTADRFPGFNMQQLRPESAGEKLPLHKNTMVVIKNHALEMDKKWAGFFDKTNARYIGILGPKKRCGQVCEHMAAGNMDRVYGPAGLDLGAVGAEQISLSIIAEMLAVWSGRPVINLRDRQGPIHGR